MTSAPDKIQDLARRIDLASTTGEIDILLQLDSECAELIIQASPEDAARLWYFRSNVSASMQEEDDPTSWNWRQPHREKQVLYLRRAIASEGFDHLDAIVRAQIHTNLANQLNSFGRPIEAIREYGKALSHVPNFAMALLNRGYARESLARLLYDRSHSAVAAYFAHSDYSTTLQGPTLWDSRYYGIHEEIKIRKSSLERIFNFEEVKNILNDESRHPAGKTKKEKEYRKWMLHNGLYMNALTGVWPHPVCASDVLHMPPHRAKTLSEPPHFISWFNQIKQEFIAARFFLFESINLYQPHFADRDTHLLDTLDAALHGIQIERMRASYRIAYGLFDKIAGLINAYFELGEKPGSVNIKSIWLTKDRKDIRTEFKDRKNLPLRGMYWLAFDIVGGDPSDNESISPHAKALYKIRNALEHRCLIIREFDFGKKPSIFETIDAETFEAHCMNLLQLVQAAIIYLSLAIWAEEANSRDDDEGVVVSMPLYPYKAPGHR